MNKNKHKKTHEQKYTSEVIQNNHRPVLTDVSQSTNSTSSSDSSEVARNFIFEDHSLRKI